MLKLRPGYAISAVRYHWVLYDDGTLDWGRRSSQYFIHRLTVDIDRAGITFVLIVFSLLMTQIDE